MLEISYKEIVQQKFEFKGFVAENFVQNEALACGFSHTYSWVSARNAELEFIFKRDDGEIIPIEVKSGRRKKQKVFVFTLIPMHPKQHTNQQQRQAAFETKQSRHFLFIMQNLFCSSLLSPKRIRIKIRPGALPR